MVAARKLDERRPRVDAADDAVRDLVGADGMVDRLHPPERRMIGREAGDIVVEVDVVTAAMGERVAFENRRDFADALPQRGP